MKIDVNFRPPSPPVAPRRPPSPDSATVPWVTGHPPTIGWYNASEEKSPEIVRHWNGERWSAPCWRDDPVVYTERARTTPDESPAGIEWRPL